MALAGCTGALSTLDPAGPAAAAIAELWWVMLVGAVLIFALVMVLLAGAFRQRPPAEADEVRLLRVWVGGLGLAFTLTVLLALFAYGLWVGAQLKPAASAQVVQVHAEARRWSWRFRYADRPGYSSENLLHIPAGRPVDVAIRSADVVHSFWVPRLAGKLDATPGHVKVLRIEAAQPGRYAGQSAEFSGPGYLDHRFTVLAHDAAGWQAFLAGEGP